MTRLITDWIRDIERGMERSEQELRTKTGYDFLSIGAAAAGVSRETILAAMDSGPVAVVPVCSGLGVISTFTDSVAAILRHMGFHAFVTERSDVDGIYEAHMRGAKLLFMADDDRYLSLNLEKNLIGDNNIATARGYVTALEGARGSLNGKSVLVLGGGIVGRESAAYLKERGAKPVIFDKNQELLEKLQRQGQQIAESPDQIRDYDLVIDATCEGGWLTSEMVHPQVFMAAMGVPLSYTAEALEVHKDRLVHDFLEIGTAVMAAMVAAMP